MKRKKLRASRDLKGLPSMIAAGVTLAVLIILLMMMKSVAPKSDIEMCGRLITLPEGYTLSSVTSSYSVAKLTGQGKNAGPLVFDSQIHGSNYQLFGSAEEVIGSSEWLTDMELYTNPAGIRMARGRNVEKQDQPELRCYVEGESTVFLISMSANPSLYDADDCSAVMQMVADAIVPDPNAAQTVTQRIARLSGKTPEEIVAQMTSRQKACQMVQPASYNVSSSVMRENCYGSLLSQPNAYSMNTWVTVTDQFQNEALRSSAGIPYIYGNDDVHGVNYCLGAVIFPHNIGIGAADDPELTRQMGLAVANEALLCHMPWNFAPCVARSVDPRWGRTYESYGSDLQLITRLGSAYVKGLTEGGAVACAKHFFGDGDVVFGSGEGTNLIDRGNAELTDEEIEAEMEVYRELIRSGAQTVMISHSSLNGIKMHQNSEYILRLKEETGFRGLIVSDWESVQHISAPSYREQIILAVNSGIDMLMEVNSYDAAADIIVHAMESGEIPVSRVDDAVKRILYVKQQAGLLDDPLFTSRELPQSEVGSKEYRALAEKLVEESLVLIKNENKLLPLESGMTVYVTGPAADNASAQCGGWTVLWNGAQSGQIKGITTALDGLKKVGAEHGIRIVTDPSEAVSADAVLLFLGEKPYAEWLGDSRDPSLDGAHALTGNRAAIEAVRALGKPTVALIIAGRHVFLRDEDLADWDSAVMCYLPGSEGSGIARVLTGEIPFTGRLPSPWYRNSDEIGTDSFRWPLGYGLSYTEKMSD